MGEAYRRQLCVEHKLSAPRRLKSANGNGVDISRWQVVPNLRASGASFVIIQANFGTAPSNPFFSAQIRAAEQAHIPWGIYTFLTGESGTAQADVALRIARSAPLGIWGDAETAGGYSSACAYASRLKTAGVRIYGIYAPRGGWPGHNCGGYNWPAEWNSGASFPLPGYSSSTMKMRQFCGTCFLPGFGGQVDLDYNLGILSLVHPHPTIEAQIEVDKARVVAAIQHQHTDTRLVKHWQHRHPGCVSPASTPQRCRTKATLVRDIHRRQNDHRYLEQRIRVLRAQIAEDEKKIR